MDVDVDGSEEEGVEVEEMTEEGEEEATAEEEEGVRFYVS